MANVTVNKHNNMLIIGKGATNKARKQIVYAEKYKDVLSTFGESELTSAFVTAKKFGAPYVFLLNCKQSYDYKNRREDLRCILHQYGIGGILRMAKIKKRDIALLRTVFLILLSLLSFVAGFSVSNKLYAQRRNPYVPRIKSRPNKSFGVPQNQTAMFYLEPTEAD